MTMEEGQDRMRRMTGQHDFYFASLEAGLLLDAGPMGSDARFAKCVRFWVVGLGGGDRSAPSKSSRMTVSHRSLLSI